MPFHRHQRLPEEGEALGSDSIGSEQEASAYETEEAQDSAGNFDEFMAGPAEKKPGFFGSIVKKLGGDKAKAGVESARNAVDHAKGAAKDRVFGGYSGAKGARQKKTDNISLLAADALMNSPDIEHKAQAVVDKHDGMAAMAKNKVKSLTGASMVERGIDVARSAHAAFAGSGPEEEKAFHKQSVLEAGRDAAEALVGKAADAATGGIVPGVGSAAKAGFGLATGMSDRRLAIAQDLGERKHSDPAAHERFLVSRGGSQADKQYLGAVSGTSIGDTAGRDLMKTGKRAGNTVASAKETLKTAAVMRNDLREDSRNWESGESEAEETAPGWVAPSLAHLFPGSGGGSPAPASSPAPRPGGLAPALPSPAPVSAPGTPGPAPAPAKDPFADFDAMWGIGEAKEAPSGAKPAEPKPKRLVDEFSSFYSS